MVEETGDHKWGYILIYQSRNFIQHMHAVAERTLSAVFFRMRGKCHEAEGRFFNPAKKNAAE